MFAFAQAKNTPEGDAYLASELCSIRCLTGHCNARRLCNPLAPIPLDLDTLLCSPLVVCLAAACACSPNCPFSRRCDPCSARPVIVRQSSPTTRRVGHPPPSTLLASPPLVVARPPVHCHICIARLSPAFCARLRITNGHLLV
jgi:hypothetical protein